MAAAVGPCIVLQARLQRPNNLAAMEVNTLAETGAVADPTCRGRKYVLWGKPSRDAPQLAFVHAKPASAQKKEPLGEFAAHALSCSYMRAAHSTRDGGHRLVHHRFNREDAAAAPPVKQRRTSSKLEFLNPGGSVKDRAALAIVEDAERRSC